MLEQKQKAPMIQGIQEWIHSDPIKLDSLQDKVVGIEFFTHSCGNCANAIPHMEKIYRKYSSKGFVLIGVHSPELPSDKQVPAIKEYLKKNHISFPVGVDNDMLTWDAYGQKYWPALYLIDKEGFVRSRHIGEGGYDRIEKEILHLLEE